DDDPDHAAADPHPPGWRADLAVGRDGDSDELGEDGFDRHEEADHLRSLVAAPAQDRLGAVEPEPDRCNRTGEGQDGNDAHRVPWSWLGMGFILDWASAPTMISRHHALDACPNSPCESRP